MIGFVMPRGTKLARLLDSQPLADWDIARYVGMHPSTLSRYRSGARELPLRHAQRFAAYFEVPLDDVIGYSEDVDA